MDELIISVRFSALLLIQLLKGVPLDYMLKIPLSKFDPHRSQPISGEAKDRGDRSLLVIFCAVGASHPRES